MSDALHEKQAQLNSMQVQAEELEASVEQLVAHKRQVGRPQGPGAALLEVPGPRAGARTVGHPGRPTGC